MVQVKYLHSISWKALIIALVLIVLPNFLLFKVELIGAVTPLMTLGSVLDLAIILPLVFYFFVFKSKPSFILFIPMSFAGLFLVNWLVPDYADDYLNKINKSVILIEGSLIIFELLLIFFILKRLPMLKHKVRDKQNNYYHFLRSFIEASKETFSFRFKKLNQYQNMLRFLSTDLAVFYYVFFSWRKKKGEQIQAADRFTYHLNGEYLGIFIMLIHALTIEIIAVHLLVMQYSHLLAWIVTLFDLYALLFIIADYQAIRQSPIIMDNKAIHIQKGLRFHAVIPYEMVDVIKKNERSESEIRKDKLAIDLTLNGLEKKTPQFEMILKEPILAYTIFGIKKKIKHLYITVDEPSTFSERAHYYVTRDQEGYDS
jgi:hypothetical protein